MNQSLGYSAVSQRSIPILCSCSYLTGATIRLPSKTLFYTPTQGNQALSGHVIATEPSVMSALTCIHYCDVIATCQSINYSTASHVCELNNATVSGGGKVESRDGFIYYQPDPLVKVLTIP